jgi:rRNA maturation protein Rpf1
VNIIVILTKPISPRFYLYLHKISLDHQLDSLKSSKNSPVGQSSIVARITAFLAPSLGGRGPLWLDMSVSQ